MTNHHNGNGNVTYEVTDDDMKDQSLLHRTRTAGTISLSPEVFEKLYLNPQNKVVGHLRGKFGNPTPLAVAGFCISLTPLTIDLMGWRGAGGFGYASIGQFYFMGGLLLVLGSILEFFLANTFAFVLFGVLGGFFTSFAATLTPAFNAFGAYSPDPTNPAEGIMSPGFNASFGFVFLSMSIVSLIFTICALRTNVCLFLAILTLLIGFPLAAGSFWAQAEGKREYARTLLTAAAADLFAGAMIGWYILAAQMLAAVDFPLSLPLGDLSGRIKGASARQRRGEP